jgi:hypothetical protein
MELRPFVKLLHLAIVISLIAFSMALSSCQTPKRTSDFEGKWKIDNIPGQKYRACLEEDDLAELTELIIRCQEK